MFDGFTKAKARVQQQTLITDARVAAGLDPLRQVSAHLRHHVAVVGAMLHIHRGALHMHKADGEPRCRRRVQGAGAREGAHVVDQARAVFRSEAHHGGGAGIDGQHHIDAPRQGLDHGYDAIQFFLLRHRVRPRARGLTAHIEDARSRRHHVLGNAPQFVQVCPATAHPAAAVRKRIRGDVEHAHDHGRGKIEGAPGEIHRAG